MWQFLCPRLRIIQFLFFIPKCDNLGIIYINTYSTHKSLSLMQMNGYRTDLNIQSHCI
jgi:hypothetical protein